MPRFAVGTNARISPSVGKVYLSADAAAFDAYRKAVQANDSVGLLDLIARNKLLSADAGAKVLILENAFGGDFIRIRLMEGPKAPQSGWLPEEWLEPQGV